MKIVKTDPNIGKAVHEHLVSLGLETPAQFNPNWMREYDAADTAAANRLKVQEHFKAIMETLGLDLTDDSLADSPSRVAKMFVDELFTGLDYSRFPKCTTVQNKMGYNQMVQVRNIEVLSVCEHHFQSITGVAHVAYIPKDKVLGLSKLNRVVEFFSRRPQIQERLTAQISEALKLILETDDVMVVLSAVHNCVRVRGVEDTHSDTATSQIGGVFEKPEPRAEFMQLLNLPPQS